MQLLCVNHDRYENHSEDAEAQFYCLLERVYLCETCLDEHRSHHHYCDSIKNHLANQFNQWRSLMDHAQAITKLQIETNLRKQEKIIPHSIKRN